MFQQVRLLRQVGPNPVRRADAKEGQIAVQGRLQLCRVHVVGAQDGPCQEHHALLRAVLGSPKGPELNKCHI